MELFAYLLIGAATGLLCRVIVPPNVQMGLIRFLIVGMVGGIAGGMITGTFFVHREAFAVEVPSIVGAVVGAAVVVFVVVSVTRKRVHA